LTIVVKGCVMSSSAVNRGRGPGAWVVLALLGWLSLATGARAHCGSWATSAAATRDPTAGLEVAALLGAVEDDPSPTCRGPYCSRSEPTPLPGRVAESLANPGDALAVVAALPAVPSSSGRPRVLDEALPSPRAVSGVFHPPRRRF